MPQNEASEDSAHHGGMTSFGDRISRCQNVALAWHVVVRAYRPSWGDSNASRASRKGALISGLYRSSQRQTLSRAGGLSETRAKGRGGCAGILGVAGRA